MNPDSHPPTAEELAELSSYLAAREHGQAPQPGEPGFPRSLAGELLELAASTRPDPAFARALELQLQKAAAGSRVAPTSQIAALWQSFTLPKRKTTMKRLIPLTILAIVLIATLWAVLPSVFPSRAPTQLALLTPPANTLQPTPLSPLTPTVAPPTAKAPVAINFTPQPIPNQPPDLPSLVNALGSGYGGSGAGNLPQGISVSLAAELPESPAQVTAYYRLENTPLTIDEARQIASQWGLADQLYIPAWMQSVSADDTQRYYVAVDGMQNLSMWNYELSFTNLAISPNFAGHQYPQSGLPSASQAVETAAQYLRNRGYLDYAYRVDLSQYAYGIVDFYRLLDDTPISYPAASVKVDSQGQVGDVWVNREGYQAVGSYPLQSAATAWQLLSAGEPGSQISISYYPAADGNPQYWGRVYPAGQAAHLFGAPAILLPAEQPGASYIQLNNLELAGDTSSLLAYLQSNPGYIHAWGEVKDENGAPTLQMAGWEAFDEFSGYFTGIVRRTSQGDFLELADGTSLSLPGLPDSLPTDLPVYAEGGRVGDSLEWFILQAHPADEGQQPPDLSLAQAVVEQVELVYLAPGLNSITPAVASDPSYRMLLPAWSFSGRIITASGQELVYRAYVQAVPNP